MITIQVTLRDGSTRAVSTEAGRTLLEAIREAGIDDLLALCGGCCSCATCHVFVDPAHPEATVPPTEDEDALLDCSEHRRSGSRLSCQIRLEEMLDGLAVTIAPED